MNTFKFALAAIVASITLGAHANPSYVSPEGVAENPVFPAMDKAWIKKGTFPNVENVKNLRAGMTPDQVRGLISTPHFSEGFRVQEWDYIFNFNIGDTVKTCQFKVAFDKDRMAQNYYWAPESCASMFKAPAAAPKQMTLSADALFAFGRSSLSDLNPAGRRQLDEIAGQIQSGQNVRVQAHTDRIGSEASNQMLSQARANTVRNYLIAQGVSSSSISAQGMGESNPVASCSQSNRAQLIACLAPNRRVTLSVQGDD